mgnify:CR=1 FL=1
MFAVRYDVLFLARAKQQRILHPIEPVVSRKRYNHDVSYIANNNVVYTEDSIEIEEEETSHLTRGVQSRRAIAGLYTI